MIFECTECEDEDPCVFNFGMGCGIPEHCPNGGSYTAVWRRKEQPKTLDTKQCPENKQVDHKFIEIDVGEDGDLGYWDFLKAVEYLVCFYEAKSQVDFNREVAGQYLNIYTRQLEAGD